MRAQCTSELMALLVLTLVGGLLACVFAWAVDHLSGTRAVLRSSPITGRSACGRTACDCGCDRGSCRCAR